LLANDIVERQCIVIESSIPIYRNISNYPFRMYVSNRIAVHPLILLLAVIAGCAGVGCNGEDHSSVPVPIRTPPYSYTGQIRRAWGGDNFEVVDNRQLHFAFIRGIDTPEPYQTYFHEAKAVLQELSWKKNITVNVFDHDDWKREVCEVRISNPETGEAIDPALVLLQKGLAWFDQSNGPHAETYREAETLAKSKKIGIWSQSNPVPPWEFWEQQVNTVRQNSD